MTVSDREEVFRHPATLSAARLTGCKNVSKASYEEGKLLARDWGLSLRLPESEEAASARYVGIRAHHLERVEAMGENVFPMEVVRVIEDVFSFRILLRPVGTAGEPLLWELAKEAWQEAQSVSPILIHLPPERLLLLRR